MTDQTQSGSAIPLPVMSTAQTAAWHALMDIHDRLDHGWTLVGGQLVHLHCAERGAFPQRPTDDADTVVDVRARPDMLLAFTRALRDFGFKPATSGDGLQHRWTHGAAQIDVLIPDGVGERARARRGAGGAPTLETPGGSQALNRTQSVRVAAEGRVGSVRRPDLVGSLVMKAAANTAVGDGAKSRHRTDFVTLCALIAARDFRTATLNAKDRKRLSDMVAACRLDAVAMSVEEAEKALALVLRALETNR